jgi:hypothetical protein
MSSSPPSSLPPPSPAFLRKRSRSSPLESTPKPYRKYIHDPDNWYRLFIAFDSRPNLKLKLKRWIRENASGVHYRTFLRRYQAWSKENKPPPPVPLPAGLNRSLSSPPCRIPGLGDGRGGHNRKWTREQEKLFVEMVVKPIINTEGISEVTVREEAAKFPELLYFNTSREGKTRSSSATLLPPPPRGNEWVTRLKHEHGFFFWHSLLLTPTPHHRQRYSNSKSLCAAGTDRNDEVWSSRSACDG